MSEGNSTFGGDYSSSSKSLTLEEISRGQAGKLAMRAASTTMKKAALLGMAKELRLSVSSILSGNAVDMEEAMGKISLVMLDRLRLDEARIEEMALGIEAVAALPDPVGEVLSSDVRPNGLSIEKVACPLGVIGIIYESRPNVTSDAAALALMAGSACILRCGKEAHCSGTAIVEAMQRGLVSAGLPKEVLTLLSDTSRESARELMRAKGLVDLLIPRGGSGLIAACVQEALVPVLETGTGICHAYVDCESDFDLALSVIDNGKTSRPSVCNSLEVCLVHEEVASAFLPRLVDRLIEKKIVEKLPTVDLKFDRKCVDIISGHRNISLAEENDFHTEFLDYKMAVKLVSSKEEAVAHISAHSTGHSEVIFTKNPDTARYFSTWVDSAAVYVNASTRFTDGGQFGLGCEMGISTQKLHARGPLGLRELCTFKFVITGEGQIR